MVEESDEFNMPQEEPKTIEHLDAEVAGLECTFEGCTSGAAGAKFKTPAGNLAHTIVYLQQHREDVHGQREAGAGGGGRKAQLSKIPRPEIDREAGGGAAKQQRQHTRHETVRQFAARLRGLAAVCDLSNHLRGLGLDVSGLLQSEINLNSSWQPGGFLRQGQRGAP